LWREENRRTRRETLGARPEPTTNTDPHMAPGRDRAKWSGKTRVTKLAMMKSDKPLGSSADSTYLPIIAFTYCNPILIQSVLRFFGTDLFNDLAPHSRGKLHHERMHADSYSPCRLLSSLEAALLLVSIKNRDLGWSNTRSPRFTDFP